MQNKNTTITSTWTTPWPFNYHNDLKAILARKEAIAHYERCSKRGLVLPIMDERHWAHSTRSILYFCGLLYSFFGIAILSEALLRAVVRITSSTRKIKFKQTQETGEDEDGSESGEYEEIRIWNPTVANLTFIALASNTAQILLPILEIIGHEFYASEHELGTSTIFGSATFNLFLLIPICILSVPKPFSKKVTQKRVFLITIGWSLFAYIWLIIILLAFSPHRIDIWESTLTLVFFALSIFTCYLTDINVCEKWRKKRAKAKAKKQVTLQEADVVEEEQKDIEADRSEEEVTIRLESVKPMYLSRWRDQLRDQFMASPLDYVDTSEWREITRTCAREHPELPPYELAKLVAYRVENQRPHDRFWYRIRAINRLSASMKREAFFDPDKRKHVPTWRLLSGGGMRAASSVSSISTLRQATVTRSVKRVMTIEFSSRIYVFDPNNENRVRLSIVRRGRSHKKAMFRYETLNGTAQREIHFIYKCETLVFQPGETHKTINVDILNGREWKRRDMFYVKLELDTIMNDEKIRIGQSNPAEISYPAWERDNIEIEFAKTNLVVRENDGLVRLPIIRKGAIKDTECIVEWCTEDITAQQGKDYEGGVGEIQFFENERMKYLDIAIIDDVKVEKTETFAVNIMNVSQGAIGSSNRAVITILNDDRTNRFLTNVDQMVPTVLQTLQETGRTWRDQLLEASTVNDGDIDNATPLDCIAHILAFPWKVIRASIPPVHFLGGWLTFFVALCLIALLTTIMGDLAAIFCCTTGLSEFVMGVTVMAIGLGLPDLLAARLAAIMDKTADTAISYIPGINFVTVFLGLGLPWFVASIVWVVRGQPFFVIRPSSSTISFGVVLVTICSVPCYVLLYVRRYFSAFGKGELGGPFVPKSICAAFLIFIWFLYVLLTALQAYKVIGGF